MFWCFVMGEILTNGITAFLQVANSNSQIVVMVTKCFSSSYNNKWCVQSYHLLLWFLCHDNYNGSLMLFRFDSPPKKWLILSHYLQCDETPNYHDFIVISISLLSLWHHSYSRTTAVRDGDRIFINLVLN